MVLLLALLASPCALAAEPAWVTTVDLPGAAGPPATRCATTATFPPLPPRVDRPEVEDTRTAGMVEIDVAPGADNTHLPPDVRARALVPVDLASLPATPLEGSASAIRHVVGVLGRAATEPVRVAMWGDSLTAGGPLPGGVRTVLQARYGDAGRGYALPAPPWRAWNTAELARCAAGVWTGESQRTKDGHADGLYGLAGITVESTDPAATAWIEGTASRVELLYLRQPGGGRVRVQVDDTAPIDVPTAAAAAGPGALVLRVPDGPHRVALSIVGDGPVRLLGAHFERDVPGVVLDGMGIAGGTAHDWSAWNEPLMTALAARRPPDLVLVEYGTNETTVPNMTPERYREGLREMLAKLRRVSPDAACVLVAPPDRGQKVLGTRYALWSPIEWVTRIQAEQAPLFGCATWSMQRAMGGPGSTFGWRLADPPLMGADFLHLTPTGYEALGKRLGDALVAAAEQ
ncbi:MAG: GDSL-type esterase/lipase family protein [Myxococcota bacterium]